jgi:NAD(P)-dependent dehydrogenase (short-subunit alcohol dehydrogenase family)
MSVVLVTGSSTGIGLATASPYAQHAHRLLLFYQMQMKTPSQPADVARVIHEAVTTKEPKLRYLVGDEPSGWSRAGAG